MLSLFDAGLHRPVISPAILVEVERSLLPGFTHVERSALRRRVAQMAESLALHTHSLDGAPYDSIAGINCRDRHVVAVAITERADLVVTNDARLRREIGSLGRGLRPVTNDQFALELLTIDRDGVDAVVNLLVSKRTRRPIRREDLADRLARSFPPSSLPCGRRSRLGPPPPLT